MNNTFNSTAMHLDHSIDARCLALSVEFYQLKKEEIIELSCSTLQWVTALMDDAFVVRYQAEHIKGTASRIKDSWTQATIEGRGCSWSAEAFAACERIYNITSMARHMTSVLRGYHPISLEVSADFSEYWNDLLPLGNDRISIIPGILKLFHQTGKKHIAAYLLPDVQMLFTGKPYARDIQQYYGSFKIYCNRFCLGSHLDSFAKSFCDFATALSEEYINMNARVQLQPLHPGWRSPYMHYFGNYGMVDDSHLDMGYLASEWYPTYYVHGVEWFNILSPLAQTHLPNNSEFLNNAENTYFQKMPHGGSIIASTKMIEAYDVNDAVALKKQIYSALYPGRSSISLKTLFQDDPMKFRFATLPRCDWAIVPLLDNEVTVIGNDLVFSHRG